MAQPEKISLWDRCFNRYRKTIHQRGEEPWCRKYSSTPYNDALNRAGQKIPGSEWDRNWVEYLIVDRVTGSEKIEKVYLN